MQEILPLALLAALMVCIAFTDNFEEKEPGQPWADPDKEREIDR